MKESSPSVQKKLLAGQEAVVQEIASMIAQSQRILIGTHQHPDGDALGSSLALWHSLKAQGKEVTIFVPDSPPAFFGFLPGLEIITSEKPAQVEDFDAIILLDYTQLYRTHLEEEVGRHLRTISIDHHYDNSKQATVNLIVGEAPATAHILFELFQTWGWEIDRDVATCLLTGIFTDTGSFMHDSVSPEILEIAAFLMTKGARLSHIAHETYQRKELPGLQIWGRALSRIMTNDATGASISVVTLDDLQECGATLDDLEGLVNMLNTLPDTKYALLLVEHQPGKVKGSFRSEPHKGVDVSLLAKRLGGGGHKLAAGFEVPGHIRKINGAWRIIPVEEKQL